MKLLLHLLTSLHGPKLTCRDVRYWSCVTSIAGPYGDTQLYER